MKKNLLVIPILLILLLMLAPPALAQVPETGGVIFGGNLTLEEGQKVDGDVVVFGGNVTMHQDSKIDGDVVIFGGNANINGKVDGDIAMIGGNISLGDDAEVNGDIGLVGGNASVAEGAKVEGQIKEVGEHDGNFTIPIPPIPDVPEPPKPPQPPEIPDFGEEFSREFEKAWNYSWLDSAMNFVEDTMWNIALLIVLAAIGWLVATFMPQQMKTVGDTIIETPVVSFGVGLLTGAIVVASFLLILTICLAFIPFLAVLFMGIAILLGWIVAGQLLGERLLAASGQHSPNFILSTVIGVTVLTLVVNMPVIGWVPCIGWLLAFLGWVAGMIITITALGAVVMTRFGTRPYYPGTPGGPAPRPRPDTYPDVDYSDEDFSDLNVNSASEVELKAKIKAALDEANVTGELEEKPKKKQTPKKKDPGEKTPQ
jgi:hypothetical protein